MKIPRLTVIAFVLFSSSALVAQIDLPPEEADKHHTELLIHKINQQLGRIVLRKHKNSLPEQKCLIFFPGNRIDPEFRIIAKSYPIRIYLPHDFSKWAFNKENLLPFVHAHLTAKTGLKKPLKDIWISIAIIQEIFVPGAIYNASGFGNYPYARAVLAHGLIPSVETILNSSMDDFYGQYTSAARAEWCSMLLKQTWKYANLWERELLQNSDLSPSLRFERMINAEQKTQKKKKLFTPQAKNIQEWFFANCSAMLLGRGIPAATPWLEENFREIVLSIQPDLKIPKKEKKDQKKLVLNNETIKKFSQAELKLNTIAMKAPEQIALKLVRFAKALRYFRDNPADKNALQTVFAEEHAVYEALSERNVLENILRKAEQKLIPPGERFALTLRLIKPEAPEIPLLRTAQKMMDRYEKEF